jgi:Sulfotransferase family
MNYHNVKFALIIGAMKCGTTSLFHYLAEHPEVAPAKDKEPHFFSEDYNFSKGMNWYRSLWDLNADRRVALEASTTYTMQPKYPNVAERIDRVKDAEFQFIYIMRHPFLRIESHIRHLLSGAHQSTADIIDEYLDFSEYATQLDAYKERFGRERIHLLFLEDLQNDPQTELCKICHFLQIDPTYKFQSVNLVLNSQKTLNLHPALRRFYNIPAVKSVGRLVPPQIRQKLYKPFSRSNPYDVKLSDRDRKLILQRLQPDFARLYTDYGVDVFQKWKLPVLN